ncbi:MAG: PEP-CTERM sorting domain-containing protein [Deltaproteobacteria bacterium]|nr:PEP-CTERM sorting domain-containing protein [Deltaproteobacteria bacterium]
MRNRVLTVVLGLTLALAAAPALADTVNFGTLPEFGSTASHQPEYFISDILPGIDLSITAWLVDQTGNNDPTQVDVSWNPNDQGIGVWGGANDDEIDGRPSPTSASEMLLLTFSEPVFLTSFSVVDLFYEYWTNTQGNTSQEHWYTEMGFADLFGTGNVPFFAPTTNLYSGEGPTQGFVTINVQPGLTNQAVTQIGFFASPGNPNHESNDYALVGVTVAGGGDTPSGTPEPGTFLLLGSALGAAGWYRRRRRA